MKMQVKVNGFEYEIEYSDHMIETVIKPMINQWTIIRKKSEHRCIVFLAAPPAVGKSTLAYAIERLSHDMKNVIPVQSLSLDGFHHKNEYLKKHNLSDIKGMPETFDLEAFKAKLKRLQYENLLWPEYDRTLHDVVEEGVKVESEIVLIEGNWLLLDEDGWRDLDQYCDYSIFIKADESLLKDRLINRKIRGGMSKEAATKFYFNSDRKNIYRVMNNQKKADLVLEMEPSGEYKIVKGE